ncbi:acetoacetate decarboxylase family protein [Actinomadura rubrisoli]|uniref:acetoacetate decarboxylase family protein n=1 Tax=Actinomadura rubrisoli TaxID=2530368 RepID=UPI002441D2D2|nr:acetoacetate decarboxylase family protein [Actinomadura rubrisoli]
MPPPLVPLISTRHLALMLIRYREGTLRYDEFMVASVVRRAHRVGLWTHHIWVDDPASLWGGRRIWGIPKRIAAFSWFGDRSKEHVRIRAETGPIAALNLSRPTGLRPALPAIAGGFGELDGDLTYFVGHLRGPVHRAAMSVTEWADVLPRLSRSTARPGIAVLPFRMTVCPPKRLGSLGVAAESGAAGVRDLA